MNVRRPGWLWAAIGGVFLVLLTSCGSGGGSSNGPGSDGRPASMQDLYAAAQKAGEKEIVVYGIKTATACYAQFSQQFPGIHVTQQYMVGETQARLQQEYISHQNAGDLLRTGDTTMLALIKQGILTSFSPAGSEALPKDAFGPNNAMINDSQRMSGIAYNAKNPTPDQAPKSWADLADPRFKDKIVMPDPTSPGAGLSILQSLLESGGPTNNDWLQRFAANKPAFVKGTQPAIDALKTGEYDVMLGGLDQTSGPALEKGTNLKYLFPVPGATPITKHYIGLITHAPHPNAAKLLETWLLSQQGQTCMAEKEGEYPVLPGVAAPKDVPNRAQLPNVSEQKPAGYDELDKQTNYLAQFKKVFGR
jgi:iron(III) transport system substrate-binding protein